MKLGARNWHCVLIVRKSRRARLLSLEAVSSRLSLEVALRLVTSCSTCVVWL